MSVRLRTICMVAICAMLSSTAMLLFAGIAAACSGGGGGGGECKAPTVSTGSATAITSNSATLNGSVNGQGCETTYSFEWGTSSSPPFPNSLSSSAGKSFSEVSTKSPLGLQPSTKYYFRLSATNSGGTTTGGTNFFTTTSACPAPVVNTEPASNIMLESATLNGSVYTPYCTVTWKLEWGPSSSPGTYPYLKSGTADGSSLVHVSTQAVALEPGRSYHFRLSATPLGGTPTYGSDKTFNAAPLTDYVALGDSYSSGTGTGPVFTGESGCRQSIYSYPYRLHNTHPEWNFIDKACHGAVTGDVISTQVNALTEKTKWVTYTIGGNDAGFEAVLDACSWPGGVSCGDLLKKAKDIIEGTLPTQFDKINHLIKLKAKWAKVIVLDYPRIFKVIPVDCDNWTFFLEADMKEMNKLAELLGKKLEEAATRAGANFIFKSVIPRFNTHALCDAQPWLNNYSDSSDRAETFHPNKLGHEQGYYPVVIGVTG
jgi:hypothetical protein